MRGDSDSHDGAGILGLQWGEPLSPSGSTSAHVQGSVVSSWSWALSLSPFVCPHIAASGIWVCLRPCSWALGAPLGNTSQLLWGTVIFALRKTSEGSPRITQLGLLSTSKPFSILRGTWRSPSVRASKWPTLGLIVGQGLTFPDLNFSTWERTTRVTLGSRRRGRQQELRAFEWPEVVQASLLSLGLTNASL